MKQKEQDVIDVAKKVLKDIEYNYYLEETIETFNTENDEYLKEQSDFDAWWFYVDVPHEQFEGQSGVLIVVVEDETLNPTIFKDGSGFRIPDLKIAKNDKGKYFIEGPLQ
jgi:hypothetical protein